jgi:hypothetical protein
MTDSLSIWNLALSHLGNKAGLSSASAPYVSREGELCGQFWPIARRFAIAKSKPSWARVRQAATLIDLGDYQPTQWVYSYQKPSNCVELIGVYEPEASRDEDRKPARVETWNNGTDDYEVIYTNVETAVIRYLKDVDDTSKFPPTFVLGVSYLLAAYLAGPLIKGADGAKMSEALENKAIAYLGLGETYEANQDDATHVFADGNHGSTWLNARGFGGSQLTEDAPILDES